MFGGLMQIVAYGAQDLYLNSYVNKTTFNSNKSFQYSGKNNFYKKHNKKKDKEIKNKENYEKINIKNKNIEKFTKVANKIKQPIYKNTSNTYNKLNTNNSTNNFIRCLSMRLIIKKNIVELLKKNCNDLDDDNLLPLVFIKIYRIFLFIVIKALYNNSTINIKDISLNNIDSLYLLKFKNIIIENNNANQFIKIIETQLKLFFEKQFSFKVKIFQKNQLDENIHSTKLNEANNLNQINKQNKQNKPNDNCPITLESLGNIYFYCNKCNTKYSPDGLMYWYQTNHKCTTPWCSNDITKFIFYNGKSNSNVNELEFIEKINYYYNLVSTEI